MTATVLAIGSQKGGVGKSTTALYLATRAAERLAGTQARPVVALVDRDEDRNLSALLGARPDLIRPGVTLVQDERLPSAREGYRLIIIDTPPGSTAIRSLREAHYIVVPVLCELQSIMGLRTYLARIESQRVMVSPTMRLLALLPTRVQPRAISDRVRLAEIGAIASAHRPPLTVLPPVPQRESIKTYDLRAREYDAPAEELFGHAAIALDHTPA